jgi:hypothetical protein
VLLLAPRGMGIMDKLAVDKLPSGGHCANVNRLPAELHFLVMQAEQEKEKRRLGSRPSRLLLGQVWIDPLAPSHFSKKTLVPIAVGAMSAYSPKAAQG